MAETISRKRIPLRPGLFKIPDDPGAKPFLVASKCEQCGKYFFPERVVCLNCGKRGVKEVALKGRGKVYTFTVARQQLPGSLIPVPYGIATITMDEGCQVETVITEGWQQLDVDMDVEVYFEKIREDAQGNEEIAYKFRPVKSR